VSDLPATPVRQLPLTEAPRSCPDARPIPSSRSGGTPLGAARCGRACVPSPNAPFGRRGSVTLASAAHAPRPAFVPVPTTLPPATSRSGHPGLPVSVASTGLRPFVRPPPYYRLGSARTRSISSTRAPPPANPAERAGSTFGLLAKGAPKSAKGALNSAVDQPIGSAKTPAVAGETRPSAELERNSATPHSVVFAQNPPTVPNPPPLLAFRATYCGVRPAEIRGLGYVIRRWVGASVLLAVRTVSGRGRGRGVAGFACYQPVSGVGVRRVGVVGLRSLVCWLHLLLVAFPRSCRGFEFDQTHIAGSLLGLLCARHDLEPVFGGVVLRRSGAVYVCGWSLVSVYVSLSCSSVVRRVECVIVGCRLAVRWAGVRCRG
jgi:hypothetical protein